jgi:hypothetical protein
MDHTKENNDKRYAVFSQHMYYLYGDGWENSVNDIPFGLAERLEEAIRKEQEEIRKAEQEHNRKIEEEEEAREKTKAEKKATLTPEEYRAWKEEASRKLRQENEEWLEQGFCDYSNYITMEHRRKEEGKVWLEDRIKEGKIRELGEGKFEYYE